MVKRKSLPKKGEKAGYAARTSQPVSDSTSSSESPSSSDDKNEESSEQEQTTRTTVRTTRLEPSTVQRSRVKKTKKKPGVVALREIRNLQKTTDLLIPRAPFLRLIRELIYLRSGTTGFRITEMAVEALREASENVLVSIFEDSYLLALHAKRVTLFPRDMTLLLRLRNDFNLITAT